MKIFEIMNLYKLINDPTVLKGHEQASHPDIPISRSRRIPRFEIPISSTKKVSIPWEDQTKLEKLPKLAVALAAQNTYGLVDCYHGDPNNFPYWDALPRQRKKYKALKEILGRQGNDMNFTEMWGSIRGGGFAGTRNYSFIIISGNSEKPNFIWRKISDGFNEELNWVWPHFGSGHMRTDDFIELQWADQHDLIHGGNVDDILQYLRY